MLNLIQLGEDQPCVYLMNAAGGNLTFELSPAAFDYLAQNLTATTANVSIDVKDELPEFIPPTQSQWGFGRVLETCRGHHNGWIQVSCHLPKITDSKKIWNWQAGFAAAMSLRNLLHPLAFQDGLGDSSAKQGVAVHGLYVGQRSCPIGALLSPWLMKRIFDAACRYGSGGIEREIADAVRHAYTHMHGYRELEQYELDQFRVKIDLDDNHCYIMIDCPGDRSGLNPPHGGKKFVLDCHNVDNPIQQLSLLAGLARLDAIARSPHLDR